jgi:NhaP-type Na+/H+ and K+/H+ antiporter
MPRKPRCSLVAHVPVKGGAAGLMSVLNEGFTGGEAQYSLNLGWVAGVLVGYQLTAGDIAVVSVVTCLCR